MIVNALRFANRSMASLAQVEVSSPSDLAIASRRARSGSVNRMRSMFDFRSVSALGGRAMAILM